MYVTYSNSCLDLTISKLSNRGVTMMNNDRIFFSMIFFVFFTVAGVLHANISKPSAESVLNQIDVMERAIDQSSVTPQHSSEQRSQLLALIKEAKVLYLTGNVKTASYLLDKAGRELYPMKAAEGIPLSGVKQQQWLDQMARVISAIIPVAEGIADEKGMGKDFINHSSDLYVQGRAAQANGNADEAERLLTDAYDALQSAVLMLRSGDQLVIQQPSDGSQQAWIEADRRYQDWRYFADWMAQTSDQLGIDAQLVDRGSLEADNLYRQAKLKADSALWLQAIAQIDQAYLTMENYWREAGIDI